MKGTLRTGVPPPHLKPITHEKSQSWKPFPHDISDIVLPVRPGQAQEFDQKICLRVNHFPLKIKLPAKLYHYVVDVTKVIEDKKPKKGAKKSSESTGEPEKKPLPRHLRYAIHRKLVDQLRKAYLDANKGKRIGLISDRSNALYSTQKLEESVPLEQIVEISPDAGEDGRCEVFRVNVARTIEKVDTSGLQHVLDNMKDTPVTSDLEALDRIYNTLMKNLKCSRYVPIGRSSLICFDGAGEPLGGGLLNFKGYDASMEITNGWKPFLNVHSKTLQCHFEMKKNFFILHSSFSVANCATLLNKNVINVFADLFKMNPESCRSTSGWTKQDFKLASDLLSSKLLWRLPV